MSFLGMKGIQVVVTEAELEKMQKLAREHGKTVEEWASGVLAAVARTIK